VLTISALAYIGLGSAVVEVALGIASFTYGGLLGVFLLGIFFRRMTSLAAMIGFAVSVLVMTWVITQTTLAWTLYTLIGSLTTLVAAHLALLIQSFWRKETLPS
jgi:solute:Na+ symporter, SSS family